MYTYIYIYDKHNHLTQEPPGNHINNYKTKMAGSPLMKPWLTCDTGTSRQSHVYKAMYTYIIYIYDKHNHLTQEPPGNHINNYKTKMAGSTLMKMVECMVESHVYIHIHI